MRQTRFFGFSLLEILVALVFISFSFLPIYNLFRFGQAGTVSNIKEIEATNYASDLVNFFREMSYTEIKEVMGSANEKKFEDDSKIKAAFPSWNLKIDEKNYVRGLRLRRFMGNREGILGFAGLLENFTKNRRAVPNYLVDVRITFKKGPGGPNDEVFLSTVVMD